MGDYLSFILSFIHLFIKEKKKTKNFILIYLSERERRAPVGEEQSERDKQTLC